MANYTFQLPGLGSYLQAATNSGDYRALPVGIVTVILIVVATDQLVWRPLIAWSDKFKFEQVESADRVTSPILALLRRSSLLSSLPGRVWTSIEEPIYRRLSRTKECRVVHPARRREIHPELRLALDARWRLRSRQSSAGEHCRPSSCSERSPGPTCSCSSKALPQPFCRVNAALLISAAWTIPVGVAIGLNPRLARIVQPIAQVLASIPATAFFPIMLIGLVKIGGGLGIGSIALMLLGTQWYILFNVIAGAMSIPSDLREVASLYHFTRWQRWTKLILPGIFPYLITGMVTASGGAWNASVFAEYSHLKDRTLADHRPRRADQLRHRQRPLPHHPARHHHDLAHGRHHESPGLAAALPPRRNPV